MESMTAMGWKRGQEEAGTVGSIVRVFGMDLGFIGSILGMFMPESGLMGRVMGVEFITVRMEVDMLGNSNGESSMDLAITILGMEIHMPGNILQTRCMDLVSILLQMAIGMRVLGMRVEGKGLECIHLEMGKHNLVIGKMEF